MMVRRYQEKDYEMIERWAKDRNIKMPPHSWFPKRGWVVDDVAAMFMFKTDSKLGFIDHFITNPKATEDHRLQATDLLMKSLEDEAEKIGLTDLVGVSNIFKVQALSARYGYRFDPTPCTRFTKHLNGN